MPLRKLAKRLIFTVFFLSFFVSCGDQLLQPWTLKILKSDESDIFKKPLQEVVFIIHGGFNSCKTANHEDFGFEPLKMDFYPQFARLIRQVEDDFKQSVPRILVGCLASDSPLEGESYYRWNRQPFPKTIQSQNIAKLIKEEILNPNAPIFLIGHSYGAWLVARMVKELGPSSQVAGLYTIDTISPQLCTPMGIIAKNVGCFRGSRDINPLDIVEVTKSWHNFYQTSDNWLKSAAFEAPFVENYEFHYVEGGHRIIDTDERVWSQITYSVLSTLKLSYR